MIALPVSTTQAIERPRVEIRGAPAKLWKGVSGEVIISGPAGTGKTRAILEWIHARCRRERLRVLILRKTLDSAKGSVMVTYTEQVLHEFDGKQSAAFDVTYFGGNRLRPAEFTYGETGSKIVIGGMNKASRILSTEYDVIYVNECTELTLDEWEKLAGRVDRPKLDDTRPPSLLLGDCNPDAPTHWIMVRANEGKVKLWHSRHEENPAMFSRKGWTPAGKRYLRRLETSTTGVRYQRYRMGKWVAAEGVIYEGWDQSRHYIDPFPIPADWPRYWCIDFGFVNPFVWGWFAVDPDGRLYLYRQIYRTHRLVEDHAAQGMALSKDEPPPLAVIVDHDAEDRATFKRKTGKDTKAAHKTVKDGIQAVASRLKIQEDGKPRLFVFRDGAIDDVQYGVVEREKDLEEVGKPSGTAEEFPTYIWDPRGDKNPEMKDKPLKEDDHGMDMTRYMVAHLDLKPRYSRIGGI